MILRIEKDQVIKQVINLDNGQAIVPSQLVINRADDVTLEHSSIAHKLSSLEERVNHIDSVSPEFKQMYRRFVRDMLNNGVDKKLGMIAVDSSDEVDWNADDYMAQIAQVSANPLRALGGSLPTLTLSIGDITLIDSMLAKRLVRLCERMNVLNQKGLFEKAQRFEPLVAKYKKVQGVLKQEVPNMGDGIAHNTVPGAINMSRVAMSTSLKETHMAGMKMASGTAQYIIIVRGLFEIIHMVLTRNVSKERIKELGKTICTASGDAYLKGISIDVFRNYLNNSSHLIARQLGRTSIPSLLVLYANSIIAISRELIDGEIDVEQFTTKMTKIFSEMSLSSAGITIGQVVIPIPVVGGIIGGMVAYTLNQTYFDSLLSLLQSKVESDVELVKERDRIQQKITELRKVRKDFEAKFEAQYTRCREFFDKKLDEVEYGILNNDRESVILALNDITLAHGGHIVEKSTADLESLIRAGKKTRFTL